MQASPQQLPLLAMSSPHCLEEIAATVSHAHVVYLILRFLSTIIFDKEFCHTWPMWNPILNFTGKTKVSLYTQPTNPHLVVAEF